ncbi:DUF1178 family protein [Telmatospirillum sp.]|uniref:DUF1178 family protein n=1 Tax=Telmatospirillum sp. TaxID=2079197 RepID=UPI00284447F9|nr:DUF1178 family protein [Telmatospirillum sp.]MDR3437966.1 DUF1178 family protein [Telmatospirillum sp.]
MILFNLICGHEHEFEGWFRSGADYDSQVAAGELVCPVCSDRSVHKAPMAPGVISGEGRANRDVDAVREALVALRKTVEENCDYVGERFPEEARRIHYGETKERPIYGHTSLDEARALFEEGVEVMLIPKRLRQDA